MFLSVKLQYDIHRNKYSTVYLARLFQCTVKCNVHKNTKSVYGTQSVQLITHYRTPMFYTTVLCVAGILGQVLLE